MLILDAPLSALVSSIAGDCIMTSILGYSDPSWSIRNSSTMVFAATMLRVVDADKNASNTDKTSSTAISITELFRRFRPISGFLSSTLRACIEEMDSNERIKSELFPVLSMLARVQSVSEGDSTIAITNDFIPLLVRCLGSRDFYIRHAAASAISNLCPQSHRECLVRDFAIWLDKESAQYKIDWNKMEGVLLAILSLQRASQEKYLGDSFKAFLNKISIRTAPPPCRSTALLLMTLYSDHEAERISRVIIHCKEVESVIASHLFTTAAEIVCRSAESKVFFAEDERMLEQGMLTLKNLLSNPLFDVRLHAVKCFKKRLNNNMSDLQRRSTTTPSPEPPVLTPKLILKGLFGLLLECIVVELNRVETESAGAHIPTLRRLSRCLLETTTCDLVALLPSEVEQLWVVSRKMIAYDFGSTVSNIDGTIVVSESDEMEPTGANLISSNGVEMMAIATTAVSTIIFSRLDKLLTVIGLLSNPLFSWRCRYSGALALERCCGLSETREDYLNDRRPLLVKHLFNFLQDSDTDVRRVAVRATLKVCKGLYDRDEENLLSEWTIVQTFALAFVPSSETGGCIKIPHDTETLLRMVLGNCRDLVSSMQRIHTEFQRTSKGFNAVTQSDDRLSNVDVSRKIFEDEDPNPFKENLLLNQLAIRSLCAVLQKDHWMAYPKSPYILELFECCENALLLLLESQNDGGLIHDVSRMPSVFPSLCSIITCTAVLMKFADHPSANETENNEIASSSQKIQALSEKLVEKSRFLHPSIFRALQLMHHQQDVTKQSVEPLLFLL
jgi:hypothetical protein